MKRWFDRCASDPCRNHFVVHTDEKGFCGEVYYAVDRQHRRAGLDIKFVPESCGRGLATDTLKIIIDRIFTVEDDVAEVWTEPSDENISAKRLYERCGMIPCERPPDMEPGYSYWSLTRDRWCGG